MSVVVAVEKALPEESAQALANFLEVNPRWDGAHWADVLEVMMDADAHLSLVEKVIDTYPEHDPEKVAAVTITMVAAANGDLEKLTLGDVRKGLEKLITEEQE
jgi:hypothetical protein